MSGLFVESFRFHDAHWRRRDLPAWAASAPAVRAVRDTGALDLARPVTLLTGDNGVGKSTLLEAIAVSCGFDPSGGAYGLPRADVGLREESVFAGIGAAIRGTRAMGGYFLRAETHLATASTSLDPNGTRLRYRSHGESLLDVAMDRFHSNGLFLLDEPEAGLSTMRQMALLAIIARTADAGGQYVIVTHSPVVLAIPGARIIEFHPDGTMDTLPLRETLAFRAWEDFLADPVGMADYMADYCADTTA